MSAAVERRWFEGVSEVLLRDQVELVEPRVIVALGQRAYDSLLRTSGRPAHNGRYRSAVENMKGVELSIGTASTTLFGVYHCGVRIQNTHRSFSRQLTDWGRVASALAR